MQNIRKDLSMGLKIGLRKQVLYSDARVSYIAVSKSFYKKNTFLQNFEIIKKYRMFIKYCVSSKILALQTPSPLMYAAMRWKFIKKKIRSYYLLFFLVEILVTFFFSWSNSCFLSFLFLGQVLVFFFFLFAFSVESVFSFFLLSRFLL